jgi:hypothetical protein
MPTQARRKMTAFQAHEEEGLVKASDWCKIAGVFPCTLRLHGRT